MLRRKRSVIHEPVAKNQPKYDEISRLFALTKNSCKALRHRRLGAFEAVPEISQYLPTKRIKSYMVHTLNLEYSLSLPEFQALLPDIRATAHFNGADLDSFMKLRKTYFVFSSDVVGITFIKVTHHPQSYYFYLHFTIDLRALIVGHLTNDLFLPDYIGLMNLSQAYCQAILKIFPSLARYDLNIARIMFESDKTTQINSGLLALPYFMLGKVSRIDYSKNLLACRYFDLTQELMKKTVFNPNLAITRPEDSNNFYASSNKTNKKNRSSLIKGYSRELYCEHLENDLEEDIYLSLIEGSKNIIRYELSRIKPKKDWVINNYSLDKEVWADNPFILSPVVLLDASICDKILVESYKKHIGLGDWYGRKQLASIIKKSGLRIKKKLLEATCPVLRKCRSVMDAYRKCTSTNGYYLNPPGKTIKMTPATFKNHLEKGLSIGVQLFSIPDERKVSHVVNPWKSALNPPKNCRIVWDIPDVFKANINAMLYIIWDRLGRYVPCQEGL